MTDRQKGRKEGRKEVRKEGRKERRKEERKTEHGGTNIENEDSGKKKQTTKKNRNY